MWIKNLSNLSNENLNSFILNYGGIGGRGVWGGGEEVNERGLNKRNYRKIIEISENVSNVVLGTSSYNNNN